MRRTDRGLGMCRWMVGLMLLAFLCGGQLWAKTVAISGLGHSIDLAHASWSYQRGDDPSFKEDAFDDSAWPITIPAAPSRATFTCLGLCWYRLKLSVPKDAHGLSLGLNNVDTSYEVFVNGEKIGGHGRMPPHPSNYTSNLTLFPVPDAQVATGSLVVAVRIWVSNLQNINEPAGGVNAGSQFLIGETSVLELHRQQDVAYSVYTSIPGMLPDMLALAVGFAALFLYRSQRQHIEYLWLSGVAGSAFALACLRIGGTFDVFSVPVATTGVALFYASAQICTIEFYFALLKRPVNLLFRISEVVYLPLTFFLIYAGPGMDVTNHAVAFQVVVALWHLPGDFLIPVLLIAAYIKGKKEAGLLLIPAVLVGLSDYIGVAWNFLGALFPNGVLPTLPAIHLGPIPIGFPSCFLMLMWTAFGIIMLNRNSVIVSERERIVAELQAAKAVQEVLIPKSLATPGFVIESVYRPAQEVGGDFFHLSPADDGSLRVVIGDVSGKGLRAAMMVSLLVGALDREASRRPGEVLAGLNRMLLQHSAGGFTTCLCLNIEADGTVTAESAGHFPPYLNGREIVMAGGLPMGLSFDAEYAETRFAIQDGDRLLLITDGVPEARRESGELYGFERMNLLISQATTASEIAAEAQRFGQDDDITVLQVTMTARVQRQDVATVFATPQQA